MSEQPTKNPEEARSESLDYDKIERLVAALEPLIKDRAELRDIDLVVEGGIGNGQVMPYAIKRLFPRALYVAMDLMLRAPVYRKSIDEQGVHRLIAANEASDIEASILNSNCYDYDLVRDIILKTGRKQALLTSCNALYALSDRWLNHYDEKTRDEMVSLSEMLTTSGPYSVQLHTSTTGTVDSSRGYAAFEREAVDQGWRFEKNDVGLLLFKS